MNIIVEGVDKAGKSTFIRMLHNDLVNKGIAAPTIRHFDKPNLSFSKNHQIDVQRFDYFWTVENSFSHYTELSKQVLICDRFHLGEMVYPPLYRGYHVDYQHRLENMMPKNTILVLLSAHHNLIKDRFEGEDYLKGNDIRKCIKLFDRAYQRSIIPMKVRIYQKWDKHTSSDENQNMASIMTYAAIRDLLPIINHYKTEPFTHTYQVKSSEEIENVRV